MRELFPHHIMEGFYTQKGHIDHYIRIIVLITSMNLEVNSGSQDE